MKILLLVFAFATTVVKAQDVLAVIINSDTIRIEGFAFNDSSLVLNSENSIQWYIGSENSLLLKRSCPNEVQYGKLLLKEIKLDTVFYYAVDEPIIVQKETFNIYFFVQDGLWIINYPSNRKRKNKIILRYFVEGIEIKDNDYPKL